jgi:hypothetical protein
MASSRRIVRTGGRFGLAGAIFGAALAVVLMSLCEINLYPLNGFIERVAFRLCPLYILGFASISWVGLIAVVLLSNAILYGAIFAVVGATLGACTRSTD